MIHDLGWVCPQCGFGHNITSSLEIELGGVVCEDCGARVELHVSAYVESVQVIERGSNHDEEE